MINTLVEKLKKSPLVLLAWTLLGKPIPPPHAYKQSVVSGHGKKFKANTLIESGTYRGDMVFGVRNKFNKIISIELSDYYFKHATKRFKGYKNIKIIKGDSGKEIEKLLNDTKSACVFWLDGHYSAGFTAKGSLNTPIINELKSILSHKIKSHVILIDDARCFIGKDDYPKISEIRNIIQGSNYHLEVKNDIIRITP